MIDAEGTSRVDETWSYVYDNLGRLMSTTVTDNGSGEVRTQKAYIYDKAGNRLTETADGVTTTNTYNSLNQMVASGSSSYIYEANGNQIKETNGSSVKEYTYDADNRLKSATFTENGSQTLLQENAYNGEGLRIAKKETKGGSSEEIRYTYQSGSVVYTDGSEGKKSLNIQGDSSNVIAAEQDTDAGKGYYFYNKDMRASTTSILDGSGNCEAAYEYTDFGETTASSDFYNEICYTGGIYDASTGLYYLNARYYDPSGGRFLTEDTYRGSANSPSSLHLYTYCANNPVNYVDPSGHMWETILDVASIGWSAAKFLAAPSWQSAGYLVWDIGAAFIPFIPGSYVKTGLKTSGKLKKLKIRIPTTTVELRKGEYLIVGSYKSLNRMFKNQKKGKIEIHHIIEKRFGDCFKSRLSTNKYASVAIDKKLHQEII